MTSVAFLSVFATEELGSTLISFMDSVEIIQISRVSTGLKKIIEKEIQEDEPIAVRLLATRIEKKMHKDLVWLFKYAEIPGDLRSYRQSLSPLLIKKARDIFNKIELNSLDEFYTATQGKVSIAKPYIAIKSRLLLDSDFDDILSVMRRNIERLSIRPSRSQSLLHDETKENTSLETALTKALFNTFIQPKIQGLKPGDIAHIASRIENSRSHIRFIVTKFLKDSNQTNLRHHFQTDEAYALLEKTWSVFFEAVQTEALPMLRSL